MAVKLLIIKRQWSLDLSNSQGHLRNMEEVVFADSGGYTEGTFIGELLPYMDFCGLCENSKRLQGFISCTPCLASGQIGFFLFYPDNNLVFANQTFWASMLAFYIQHNTRCHPKLAKTHFIQQFNRYRSNIGKVDVNMAESLGGLGGPMLAKWRKFYWGNAGTKPLPKRMANADPVLVRCQFTIWVEYNINCRKWLPRH